MKRIHASTGNYLLYLFPVVILCYTFTLLWGWFPYTHSIITIIVGMVAGLVVSSKYFTTKPFAYLLLYILVLLVNVFLGDIHYKTPRVVFNVTIEILLPILITYGILTSNTQKILKVTVDCVLYMIIINAVCSFIIDMTMLGSIRSIHGTIRETGDNTIALTFYKLGLANYIMPHALPCIIPILIIGIKVIKDKFTKWFMIASLIACLLLVYLSGATTPVLTAMIAVALGLFTNRKTGAKQLITLGVLFVLMYVIVTSEDIMLPLLRNLDNLMNNQGYFHSKIIEFENLIVYGETSGDMEQREDLYMTTWNAIISNPIFGVDSEIGGHSFLLDRWGALGLIGVIPFLCFLFSQVKMFAKKISSAYFFYYYEGFFLTLLMLALKNVAGWESWLFLFTVLPLLTIYIERMGVNKKWYKNNYK